MHTELNFTQINTINNFGLQLSKINGVENLYDDYDNVD